MGMRLAASAHMSVGNKTSGMVDFIVWVLPNIACQCCVVRSCHDVLAGDELEARDRCVPKVIYAMELR